MKHNEHYNNFIEKTYCSFRDAYFSDQNAMLTAPQYESLTRKLIGIGGDIYVYFNPELVAAHNYLRIAENTDITDKEYNAILSNILEVDTDDVWLKKYVQHLKLLRKLLKGDAETINTYTSGALDEVDEPELLLQHVKKYTTNICNYWCDFYKHRMIIEGVILT
ncbi:MAG: hypothetical protein MK137_00395 [Rickettsiales bacterium]|nr:hypothetical protein [Rickettsiales bacterium]